MQITKFVPATREEVFRAFTRPRELEKWCYPEGLTLIVPFFEGKGGGRYRYIHQGMEGVYNCEGHFQEFIENESLAFIDERVTDPNGSIIFENLRGTVSFRDKAAGTEITVGQEGFRNEEEARLCEQGWVDSLLHLTDYLSKSSSPRTREEGGRSVETY